MVVQMNAGVPQMSLNVAGSFARNVDAQEKTA